MLVGGADGVDIAVVDRVAEGVGYGGGALGLGEASVAVSASWRNHTFWCAHLLTWGTQLLEAHGIDVGIFYFFIVSIERRFWDTWGGKNWIGAVIDRNLI